jgi:hypothetical protein
MNLPGGGANVLPNFDQNFIFKSDTSPLSMQYSVRSPK